MIMADLVKEAKDHAHAEDHHGEDHKLMHRSTCQAPEAPHIPSLYPLSTQGCASLRLFMLCLWCMHFFVTALA